MGVRVRRAEIDVEAEVATVTLQEPFPPE